MLPAGEARLHHPVEVGEYLVEGLGLFGGMLGEKVHDVARLHVGDDGQFFDVAQIVGDPIDDPVGTSSELFDGHVEARLLNWLADGI
jgi:hypothetical protein